MAVQLIRNGFNQSLRNIYYNVMFYIIRCKAVVKASTHEVQGPKRKHLDYLVTLTGAPNVNLPELANQLVERTRNSSWVVVFKVNIITSLWRHNNFNHRHSLPLIILCVTEMKDFFNHALRGCAYFHFKNSKTEVHPR